jgi:hypothetical protein
VSGGFSRGAELHAVALEGATSCRRLLVQTRPVTSAVGWGSMYVLISATRTLKNETGGLPDGGL